MAGSAGWNRRSISLHTYRLLRQFPDQLPVRRIRQVRKISHQQTIEQVLNLGSLNAMPGPQQHGGDAKNAMDARAKT